MVIASALIVAAHLPLEHGRAFRAHGTAQEAAALPYGPCVGIGRGLKTLDGLPKPDLKISEEPLSVGML